MITIKLHNETFEHWTKPAFKNLGDAVAFKSFLLDGLRELNFKISSTDDLVVELDGIDIEDEFTE
jgi:hypothetical protein